MSARFKTKARNVTFVIFYAPTNDAEDDVNEIVYTQLSESIAKVRRVDVNIAMGDVIAKVGSSRTNWEHFMVNYGL